jgi:LppX_LprAFG lipoprotein
MRPSPTLRRSLAALALPLLMGGLAACGSDDDSAEPAASSSSASASEQSPDAGAATAGEKVDPAAFVDDLQAGLKASTTAKMTMQLNMGGQEINADGAVDYTTTPPNMAMTMQSPALASDQSIEMRLVDKVLYMNMGQMTNNKFVSYDLSDADNLPPGMDQLTNTLNPLAAFDSFEEGIKSVVFVGDENVDGEQLGHYEITVDTSKIDQLKDLPTQAQLPDNVNYDLWLDDQNRMRKMTMKLESGTPMDTEVEFSKWGESVDIAAPPASDVVDGSKLAG